MFHDTLHNFMRNILSNEVEDEIVSGTQVKVLEELSVGNSQQQSSEKYCF